MNNDLYIKTRKNWQYLHPINKFFTKTDYLAEKLGHNIKQANFLKYLRYKFNETWRIRNWFLVHKNTNTRSRHWYE